MKKNILAAIIATAAMTAAFAGCNPDTDKPTPTEVATTENAEAIATEKTESAATETAENTVEAVTPTEESKYAVLDFNECAEEVLRLKPYVGTSLSEDADGNTVLYFEGDGSNYAPCFFTDGTKLYVENDGFVQAYDKDGFLYRIEDKCDINSGACLIDGKIYSVGGVSDAQTGESETTVDFINRFDFVAKKEKIYIHNNEARLSCDDYFERGVITDYYLDVSQAVWVKGDEIFSRENLDDDRSTVITLPNGSKTSMPYGTNKFVGIDNNGNYYFQMNELPAVNGSNSNWKSSIIKIDSNGNIVSYCMMPFDINEELWDNDCSFYLLPDGTVYVAAATNDAYVIWKINM